ncbi:hypothetical protein RJ639_016962 [Escallonia herrerae]|uniref:Uncharacterized protein n=1 Tax=Escallonia herrerae TaxID=1293975 RepID=A0AA88VCB2_9ASTE|nr:hypothetical protein RJ639_016962 [Escallonia herrerae]
MKLHSSARSSLALELSRNAGNPAAKPLPNILRRELYDDYKFLPNRTILLDGVANTGIVELGNVQLSTYLAEKKSTGQPFFRNGMPSLVAFPPHCRTSSCLVRYGGELSVDAVSDWFATSILHLPRITYYSKESMVKVIFISKTGERATPFVRQAAKNYWAYTSFAFALWREEESSFWWNVYVYLLLPAFQCFIVSKEKVYPVDQVVATDNRFEVESAPAIVILKDPGVKPVVYSGMFLSLDFITRLLFVLVYICLLFLLTFSLSVLPQLRSVTSMELGCDARGFSRAGNDTRIWYCAILAGRQSIELDKMREIIAVVKKHENIASSLAHGKNYILSKTMRRVQEILSNDVDSIDQDPSSALSAIALKEKRLTFTWLDGEAQNRYCFFYIHSEQSYETCGPRRDITDVPQLFIVRYKRADDEDSKKIEEDPKNYFGAAFTSDLDPTSQLVANYNGSVEVPQIIRWVSKIISDGDSRELPFFRARTPELVPEDADPILSRGTAKVLSSSKGMKQRIQSIGLGICDSLTDPRIGPILLLGALMSFGSIWLRRSQSTLSSEPNNPSQPNPTDEVRPNQRHHPRRGSSGDRPESITDVEPNDAFQMPFSDSDSD